MNEQFILLIFLFWEVVHTPLARLFLIAGKNPQEFSGSTSPEISPAFSLLIFQVFPRRTFLAAASLILHYPAVASSMMEYPFEPSKGGLVLPTTGPSNGPYLEIINHTSLNEEKVTKFGQTYNVHVVVKNSPFVVTVAMRNGRGHTFNHLGAACSRIAGPTRSFCPRWRMMEK